MNKTTEEQVEENRILFQSQADEYENTLVLDMFNVVRLVGLKHAEDDFYWILNSPEDGIYYLSCVMGFIPLKGTLSEKHYEGLVKIWNLNNEEKVE